MEKINPGHASLRSRGCSLGKNFSKTLTYLVRKFRLVVNLYVRDPLFRFKEGDENNPVPLPGRTAKRVDSGVVDTVIRPLELPFDVAVLESSPDFKPMDGLVNIRAFNGKVPGVDKPRKRVRPISFGNNGVVKDRLPLP